LFYLAFGERLVKIGRKFFKFRFFGVYMRAAATCVPGDIDVDTVSILAIRKIIVVNIIVAKFLQSGETLCRKSHRPA